MKKAENISITVDKKKKRKNWKTRNKKIRNMSIFAR